MSGSFFGLTLDTANSRNFRKWIRKFSVDEILANETEVELVSSFLQDLHDWGELGDDVEPGQRVKVGHEFNTRIAEPLDLIGIRWAIHLTRPPIFDETSY
jgi:hypothetical protein